MIGVGVALLRTKVAALLLGPAGVGLIGLFTNLVTTASTVGGLGFGNVGTRQIVHATVENDETRIVTARRALFWGSLGLAALSAGSFWGLRNVMAQLVLDDQLLASDIGWLAIAVALSIGAASQKALLNGMRKIGDIARVSVGSALLSTVLGIGALFLYGRAGIVAFVVAAPLASFVLGHWYVSRLPKMQRTPVRVRPLMREWGDLARLGFAFMVAGLAGTIGQLFVRLLVQNELGVEALGHFHAAWSISMTYIGLVLTAMGTDYYPRLTAVIEDPDAVNRLVNEQMEVALLLAAPILLAMLGLAPWIVELLYTSQFGDAVEVLRWQVLGDVLKIASWPLGFILLAAGSGKSFVWTQWLQIATFGGLSFVLLPMLDLVATGVAFLGMYGVGLSLNFALAKRRTRFRFSSHALWLLCALTSVSVLLFLAASLSKMGGALAGAAASAGFASYAFMRLSHVGDIGGPVARVCAVIKRFGKRPRDHHES